MPITDEQLAPAQFISAAGSTFVLPPNARPDLAFEQTITWPALAGQGRAWNEYDVPATYYVVLLLCTFVMITSAAVGNRVVVLELLGSDNVTVFEVPAIGTQPENTNYQYTYQVNISSAYATATIYNLQPLPPVVGMPTQKFVANAQGTASNLDQIAQLRATMVFIPTGPAVVLTPPAPVAAITSNVLV